jgi:hypothetical protein
MSRSTSKNGGDQPATQHDLEIWGNQLSLQIEDIGNKIMKHIDAAIENRASDLLGVAGDEVKLIKDKTENHEERIVTLEKHAGVR